MPYSSPDTPFQLKLYLHFIIFALRASCPAHTVNLITRLRHPASGPNARLSILSV